MVKLGEKAVHVAAGQLGVAGQLQVLHRTDETQIEKKKQMSVCSCINKLSINFFQFSCTCT